MRLRSEAEAVCVFKFLCSFMESASTRLGGTEVSTQGRHPLKIDVRPKEALIETEKKYFQLQGASSLERRLK